MSSNEQAVIDCTDDMVSKIRQAMTLQLEKGEPFNFSFVLPIQREGYGELVEFNINNEEEFDSQSEALRSFCRSSVESFVAHLDKLGYMVVRKT